MRKLLFMLSCIVPFIHACQSEPRADYHPGHNMNGPVKSVRAIPYDMSGHAMGAAIGIYSHFNPEGNIYEEYDPEGRLTVRIAFGSNNMRLMKENMEYHKDHMVIRRQFAEKTASTYITRKIKNGRFVSGELRDKDDDLVATELYEYKDSKKELDITVTLSNSQGKTLAINRKRYVADNMRKDITEWSQPPVTEERFYHNDGKLSYMTNYLSDSTMTVNYQYTDFDIYGNWTGRLTCRGKRAFILTRRVIEYYD